MKILNKTYRDVTPDESTVQKTPITGLAQTYSIPSGSFIHIVENLGDDKGYESKKITTDDFQQKIYEAVQNRLKNRYWATHELISERLGPSNIHDQLEERNAGERPVGTSFKSLVEYLKNRDTNKNPEETTVYTPDEVESDDPNGFVNHLYYDFDVIKRYMVLNDNELSGLIKLCNGRIDELDCYFSPSMSIKKGMLDNNNETGTTEGSASHDETETDEYCEMVIADGNKISNSWTCPETGNLVVYGWVDSSDCLGNKSPSSAFCVLEATINARWEIISVSQVLPAKNIAYVGFNVPVKSGLVVRVRTGFTCGSKSGQFSNPQDGNDTITNSTPNGFRCMVFSGKGT